MKSTVEIPDELYRRVKTRAAAEGLTVREVTIDLYQSWVAAVQKEAPISGREWLDRWVALGRSATEGHTPPPTVRDLIEKERGRLDP